MRFCNDVTTFSNDVIALCCLQVLPELMPALKGVVMTCDLQLTSRCLTALLSLHTGASGAVGVVKVASCGVSGGGGWEEGCGGWSHLIRTH